jgi:hypothetical protein
MADPCQQPKWQRMQAPPLTVTQADFDMKEMGLGVLHDESDEDSADCYNVALTHEDAAKAASQPRTKKDRARHLQYRQLEAEAEARRSLKRLRRQLENVGVLQQEIQQTESDRALRAARRQVHFRLEGANGLLFACVPVFKHVYRHAGGTLHLHWTCEASLPEHPSPRSIPPSSLHRSVCGGL